MAARYSSARNRHIRSANLPRLGAPDQQPQRERDLPEEDRLKDLKELVLILRPQHAGGAQGNPGEAAEREPDAQEPRQEARPPYEHGQREEPDSPEGLGGDVLLASQLQKQHRQRVLLRLVEDGQ